jgi:hypothetical protein
VHVPSLLGALFGLFRMRGVSKCDATWRAGCILFRGEVDTCGASIIVGCGDPRRPEIFLKIADSYVSQETWCAPHRTAPHRTPLADKFAALYGRCAPDSLPRVPRPNGAGLGGAGPWARRCTFYRPCPNPKSCHTLPSTPSVARWRRLRAHAGGAPVAPGGGGGVDLPAHIFDRRAMAIREAAVAVAMVHECVVATYVSARHPCPPRTPPPSGPAPTPDPAPDFFLVAVPTQP